MKLPLIYPPRKRTVHVLLVSFVIVVIFFVAGSYIFGSPNVIPQPWPYTSSPWKSKNCPPREVPAWYSQYGEDKFAQQLLYHFQVCEGNFVEIGAYDGLTFSVSKAYEDSFAWKGLLIEANPVNYKQLVKNRPNALKIHGATCPENQTTVKFAGTGTIGGPVSSLTEKHAKTWGINSKNYTLVPCQPLYRMLSSAHFDAVDLFVLDVEDAELEVLKTMDWTIPVGFWIVELPGRNKIKDRKVKDLMHQHGYIMVRFSGSGRGNTGFLHQRYREHLKTIGL